MLNMAQACEGATAALQRKFASSDAALAGEDDLGRLVLWSRGASCLLGFEPEVVLGLPLPIQSPPSSAALARARKSVLEGGLALLDDVLFQRADAASVAIDLLATPLPIWHCGRGILWTMTAARPVQAQRVQTNDAENIVVHNLIEAVPIPVFVKDAQGHYTAFNRAWEDFFGRHREDWIGRTVAEKFPPHIALAYQQQDEQLLHSGGMVEWEDELRSSRGGATPVIYRKTALRTADGRIMGVVGTILDVTKLRLAESRFQLVVEMTPGALIVCDPRGRILLVNAQTERLFGYARTDLMNMSIEQLLPERHRAAHAAYRDGYAGEAVIRPMGRGRDLYARRRDGEELPVEVALGPLPSDEGERVIAVVADISARVAAHRQIEASLREKIILLDEIHHRVKNNLQIIGSLLSLQATSSPEAPVRAALQDAMGRVRSIGLMHELLYEHSNLSTIDLGTYLDRLIRLVRGAAGDEHAHVSFELELGNVPVEMGQALHCGLIANEILTNALKHAFPPAQRGCIRVSLSSVIVDEALLVVSDNGKGYPSDLDVESPRTLGFRLIRLLTDQIGGSLRVAHHESPGQSVRFELAFPAYGRKKSHDRR